jgi:hypothetical protein
MKQLSFSPIPDTISGRMALVFRNNLRFIHAVEKSEKMEMNRGLINNRFKGKALWEHVAFITAVTPGNLM